MPLPAYDEFVAARQKIVQPGILEIYGGYSATRSEKTIRSQFNLLLQPGQKAYIEILNPSKQLIYAVGLNASEIILSYVQHSQYIKEEATTRNLEAVTGLPLAPDDLLLLIAGYGLDFADWQVMQSVEDGWNLQRGDFSASVKMQEQIVQIEVNSPGHPKLLIEYDEYRPMDGGYTLPSKIRFKLPARKMAVEWNVEKFLPRDAPASVDLFAVQLKSGAKQLALNDVYKGQPLLLE